MAQEAAIGIDLGTTYSCVGVLQYGKVEIIANSLGSRLTPSCVAFTDRGRLIGDSAENHKTVDPHNTVFDTKRIIGRDLKDPLLQADMKYWPFRVDEDVGGRPVVEVEFRGRVRRFTPEEISAMVLTKMKETAEAYLGYKVKNAVITVPAYFNDAQRQATRDAGLIAGLNVLRILNEPTAAAIAYGLDKKSETKGSLNVLIYDIGGGTFDVSVLTIDGTVIQVKGVSGDTHLGGEDFDNRLLDYFADEFAYKYSKDIGSNKRALRRLKAACEGAKRALSSMPEASIELDALVDGVDFHSRITRAKFNELCGDIFLYTLEPVNKALTDANLERADIDEIIVVGGSSRIPRLRELLQEYFFGKELNTSIDPDEAVVVGAAIEAAILNGSDTGEVFGNMLLLDVTPLSLGVESSGGVMTTVIPRNTPLPAHRVHHFSTNSDNQTSVTVKVYEGERAMTRDNRLLGVFDLVGLKPMPRGTHTIEVKFDIDVDGILSVAAIEPVSGVHERATIYHDTNRLTAPEIERMIVEAEDFEFEDVQERNRAQARIELESYISTLKTVLDQAEEKSSVTSEMMVDARQKIVGVQNWVNKNQFESREGYEVQKEELASSLHHVLLAIDPLQLKKLEEVRSFGSPSRFPLQEPSPEDA